MFKPHDFCFPLWRKTPSLLYVSEGDVKVSLHPPEPASLSAESGDPENSTPVHI